MTESTRENRRRVPMNEQNDLASDDAPTSHEMRREANLVALRVAFEGVSNADADAQLAQYTDDMVLELPFADPPVTVQGKADAFAMLTRAFEVCRMALRITDVHWCLDPDELVVEFESEGYMATTGRAYANAYIAVVRFRDGRICHQREFFVPRVAEWALAQDG
ncbi:MAG: nuclear transport factor 2 family protein [Xanthomonadales bacterium]|nr:nuclear transport factor 2 family protein [Xanthomonadales bacterium]